MFARFAPGILSSAGRNMTFFGRRFLSGSAAYEKCYQVIENNQHYNSIFMGEIKDAIKTIEHADKNNIRLKPEFLDDVAELKYSLSRTYDHPESWKEFEPVHSVLNKAEELFNRSSFSSRG